MTNLLIILKALLIGFTISIPVGPIVIMVVQRSLSGGRGAGMAAASGSILADTVFAIIALFAFKVISGFLDNYTFVIELIGGAIIAAVGFFMFAGKPREKKPLSTGRVVLDSSKAFMMGITNPGSFFWIIATFASFGFDPDEMTRVQDIMIIASVSVGAFLYWFALTTLASKGENKFKIETLMKINKISGIAIMVFGLFFITKGIIERFA